MAHPIGPPPLSPLSISSNDSSFVGRYGNIADTSGAATPPSSDIPYTGGPYNAARPLHTSPPSSQHPSGSTDMSRPSASGSSFNGNRPPSSASSIGMSSDGRMGFGKPPNRDRESSGSAMRPAGEDALQRHYAALKTYLREHLQDEKGNMKPNRARDKLLRLSVTQFMELSTDVYDELIRREDERTQRVPNVPRFLLPKQNFHPKRNQARQKLSTLPTERFRQLATDVFYELERRIPRLRGGRPDSTMSNASARSRGGMRPPGAGYGYPPPGGRGRGFGPGMGPPRPYSPGPNGMPPPSPGMRRPSEAGSLGRPLPKALQSNTIVPNKSTMIEDDDDMEDDEDAFGLDHVSVGLSPGVEDAPNSSAAEITGLKEKIEQLETQLAEKEQEIEKGASETERNEWESLRKEMEQELELHKTQAKESEELRSQQNRQLESLKAQVERHESQASSAEYEERIRELEEQLARQETISNEVLAEAQEHIREMRELSKQNDEAIEKEEQMAARIAKLEQENSEWRKRYAKVKSQNKSLRASTMGLGLQTGFDSGSLVRQEGLISQGGLVRDTDVTRFQLAVEELLKNSRQTGTEVMLESVKNVVISVQSITAAVGTDGYPTPSASPLGPDSTAPPVAGVGKLKARVTGTANSLITATKQHATSHGLSPVALLDAAASNLTAAVVELIKAVRIRPSNHSDYQDLEATDELSSFYGDSMSPSAEDPHSLQIPVPQISTHHEPAQEAASHSHENSAKTPASSKTGWFSWGGKRKGNEGGHAQANGAAHSDESDGEYDPYR